MGKILKIQEMKLRKEVKVLYCPATVREPKAYKTLCGNLGMGSFR